jgi:alkanesulfonate monooxygenase SsuD/methylene tetrahydromethanopterin reductase-like flavin-dependent oxidoreductase (luciferase family)
MMAGTWSRLGGGDRKVYLGIGAGGQNIVEQWHGVDFDKPATTTRDTLRIIRQAVSGERTSYLGKARHSERYQSLIGPSPEVRIYVGGMGPAMISMAAEEADGLILTWISPRVLRDIRDDFVDQVAHAGRTSNEVRLVARAYVAITDQPEVAREEVRKELVEYLLSPPYGRYFGSIGFQREVDEVNAAYRERNRAGAVAAVSDAMLDEFFIGATTGAGVFERLTAYLDAGADEVLIQPVIAARGGNPSRTIEEVAAAFRDAPFE